MMNFFYWLNLADKIAPIIGIFGIGIGAYQLKHTRQQALTTFEDSLAREYRELANRLPTKALLGKPLNEVEQQIAFDELYHYFDLSNEQVFLRNIGRVRRDTWIYWRDGIKANFGRPAFACAWEEIKTLAPKDFTELHRLIEGNFQEDPEKWKKRPSKKAKF